jgi:hypothetical protein
MEVVLIILAWLSPSMYLLSCAVNTNDSSLGSLFVRQAFYAIVWPIGIILNLIWGLRE